jgi:hypothetical protein
MHMKSITFLAIVIFLPLSLFAQVPTAGLVAYYPLNGNATDMSGNGNNGTILNATLTSDRFGNPNSAYEFGGFYNQGYIHVPNSTSLQFSTGAAVSAWVRLDSTSGSDINNNYSALGAYSVFSKDWDWDGVAGKIVFWSPPQVYIYSDEVTGEPFQPLSAYTHVDSAGMLVSKWVHIVFNLALDTPRIYIDGERIAGGDTTHYNFASTNQNDLYFGRFSNGWYPLSGALDDIRIYDRTLSDTEIQALYHEGGYGVQQFRAFDLTISDSGSDHATLQFGAIIGATNGLDTTLGETELPPIPPRGSFDARWLIENSNGSFTNNEDTLGGTHLTNTYTATVQPGPSGYPISVSWPSSLPPGTFFLQDAATGGNLYEVNMSVQSSFIITDSTSLPFQITYDLRSTISSQVLPGWNVLSLPCTVLNPYYTAVIPQTASRPFIFSDSGYVAQDSLKPGNGFWLKIPTSRTIAFHGNSVAQETIAVRAGWNLVGASALTVPVGSLRTAPSGMALSQFYLYGGGYAVTQFLVPGAGYWVKTSEMGQIILPAPSSRVSPVSTRSRHSPGK